MRHRGPGTPTTRSSTPRTHRRAGRTRRSGWPAACTTCRCATRTRSTTSSTARCGSPTTRPVGRDVEVLAAVLPDNGIMSPREDLPSPVVVTVWGAQLALDDAVTTAAATLPRGVRRRAHRPGVRRDVQRRHPGPERCGAGAGHRGLTPGPQRPEPRGASVPARQRERKSSSARLNSLRVAHVEAVRRALDDDQLGAGDRLVRAPARALEGHVASPSPWMTSVGTVIRRGRHGSRWSRTPPCSERGRLVGSAGTARSPPGAAPR